MSTQQLAQAPDFTLDHVLGHQVSLSDHRGQRVVVIFGGRDTTDQVKQGLTTLRRSLGPDQLTIFTVLDLRQVPRPARMVIKGRLKKGYEDMTSEVEAQGLGGGVNMLVDWSGKVVDSYGISVEEQAISVVIDEQGRIIGYGSGDQLGEQSLSVLSSR